MKDLGSGPRYRVKQGDYLFCQVIAAIVLTNNPPIPVQGIARLIYDDGTEDEIIFPQKVFPGVTSGSAITSGIAGNKSVSKNGWLVEWCMQGPASIPANSLWVVARISEEQSNVNSTQIVGKGPIHLGENSNLLGTWIAYDSDKWPTWVCVVTIQEDATVGTHVCSVSVSPGTGGAMDFLYGYIIFTGAAAQSAQASIWDAGALHVLGGIFQTSPAGSAQYSFPFASGIGNAAAAGTQFRVSGAMQLILSTTTSTVSDLETFSVVCRVNPLTVPLVTAADSVGTPTITVSTNAYF